jgi:hypothetical protein
VASDVFSIKLQELCTDYATKKQNMFSLDTPVIINGNLTGPNLLRTTDSIKLCDHETSTLPGLFQT